MTDQPTESREELYYPSPDVLAQAYIKDWDELARQADEDFVGFWEERAKELIDWHAPWSKVLDDSNKPFFKWFVDAKTNIVYNAIDRHLKTARKNKLALIWEGEKGEQRTFSYFALNREVSKFASVLKALGVKKGDRVTIYMGRVPELPIAMLACAKIGAVHSVVYGGFSTEALHGRIEDSQSRVVITCDGAFLNGKIVELKKIADEAIKRAPIVEHVVVFKRTGQPVNMEEGRDMWWHDLMALPIADWRCPTEILDAEDPLYHAVHLRHDRQAQSHRAHARRLSGGHRDDAEVCVRSQRRRSLVVRGRSGLGHRPLLHRLRAADSGRDQHHVRRRADVSVSRSVVADRREVWRQRVLHRADGDSRPDALWRGMAQSPRSVVAATARFRRRADQSRSVALVLQEHRQRALPDHGYVVADRDRHVHDHARAQSCR